MRRDWWSIQYLRAIAALMVVFHHAREQFTWVKDAFPTNVGGGGVDIFFVVSGFVMVFITASGRTSPADFLARRVIRIAPLYWIFTLLLVGLLLAAPALFRSVQFDAGHLLQSLFFIPHEAPDGRLRPILTLGWTLNYEMFFYLIFAALLPIRQGLRICLIGIAFIALILVNVLGAAPSDSPAWRFLSHPIILEFVYGMALAHLVTRGVQIPAAFALVLLVFGAAAFIALAWAAPEDMPTRAAVFGLPALAMVAGLLGLEQRNWIVHLGPLRALGDASYALYLSHIFTLGGLRWIWARLDAPSNAALFVLVGLITCSVIAVLIHYAIERPILTTLNRPLRRPAPIPAPQASQHTG